MRYSDSWSSLGAASDISVIAAKGTCRALLGRTAEGGCPYMDFDGVLHLALRKNNSDVRVFRNGARRSQARNRYYDPHTSEVELSRGRLALPATAGA